MIIIFILFAGYPSKAKAPEQDTQNQCLIVPICVMIKNDNKAEELAQTLIQKAKRLEGKHGGQCVEFVQFFLKVFEDCKTEKCMMEHPFRGRADSIEPNSDQAVIGEAVLLREGQVGHTAVIIDMTEETIIVAESNYNYDEIITVGREIRKDDEVIRGYFDFR